MDVLEATMLLLVQCYEIKKASLSGHVLFYELVLCRGPTTTNKLHVLFLQHLFGKYTLVEKEAN